MATCLDLIKTHYAEAGLNGFTAGDGVVAFYAQIEALLTPQSRVLDFGAGRGAHISEDPVAYRRRLQDIRAPGRHIEGCDIDRAVADNPFLDGWQIIEPGRPLPYAAASFDMIISRSVFEHVEFPHEVAAELARVLKPGGVIAIMTPNGFGYGALATRMIPNRLHAAVLRSVQPERKAEDVFPTFYRMNRPGALRRVFGPGFSVHWFSVWAEPYYHFNNRFLFRLIKLFHSVAPDILAPTLCMFVRRDGIA